MDTIIGSLDLSIRVMEPDLTRQGKIPAVRDL